ncbi:SGNH/GDSL hydrolase family protein [Spirillospora sp. NBC_01491]|uniref:SGNH/GDSL hydrolase family protein n=1 Tax=Spirillospora sp. NBC_01491 TaxID=2976007 RepID=UPI002E2EE299|nr:SGNH/GDSL hydrolase family protein [Spirillospora sp. NBC_01491]
MNFTRHTRSFRIPLAVLGGTALTGGLVYAATASAAAPAAPGGWVQSWAAAPQRPVAGNEDDGANWSTTGFKDQSLRQVIRVGQGGARVRIRLSNRYGTKPLKVAGATVARSAGGAQAWPDTSARVTFGGAASVMVKPGAELVGDPVALSTSPLEKLAVTLRFTSATGPATFHRFTTQAAYLAKGDHTADPAGGAFTASTDALYYLTGVDVAGGKVAGTAVAFGDSLVDGTGSTGEGRWPDVLAGRLLTAGRPATSVNAGIAGNQLLADSPCFGDKALTRFRKDVLDVPGVRSVLIHLGANDIGASQVQNECQRRAAPVTPQELIAGHRELIRAAHSRGVKATGVTVLPLKGALFPIWSPEGEKARQGLNHWIRTSGEYDAVLDADRAMAGPADPDRSLLAYTFQDGLHPNDAGHQAIARAADLGAL